MKVQAAETNHEELSSSNGLLNKNQQQDDILTEKKVKNNNATYSKLLQNKFIAAQSNEVLNQSQGGKTTEEIFRDLTVTLDLTRLLEIKEVITPEIYDNNRRSCVVIVELKHPKIREAYGDRRYILQCFYENRMTFQITLNEMPHLCVYPEEQTMSLVALLVKEEGKRTLYFIDMSQEEWEKRVCSSEIDTDQTIFDIRVDLELTEISFITAEGRQKIPYQSIVKGRTITLKSEKKINEDKFLSKSKVCRFSLYNLISLDSESKGLIHYSIQDNETSTEILCQKDSKITKYCSSPLDYYADYITVILRENGSIQILKGKEEVFDSASSEEQDPTTVRGMIETTLKELKLLKFKDAMITRDQLYLLEINGNIHQYNINRYTSELQLFGKIGLQQGINDWNLILYNYAQSQADTKHYWFSDYMLEDTCVQIAFNSLLITLDIYYPGNGENYQVVKVLRLDYRIQSFIPYDTYEAAGGHTYPEYKKTGIHMVGIHKFRGEVFADWDAREAYQQEKVQHKELIGCQTIVIQTDNEQRQDDYSVIPEIQIFELNGKIKQMITHKFEMHLHSVYTVEDKKEKISQQYQEMIPIYHSSGNVSIGAWIYEKGIIIVASPEGYQTTLIDFSKEANHVLKSAEPILIVEPHNEEHKIVVFCQGEIMVYDRLVDKIETVYKDYNISLDQVHIVDCQFVYIAGYYGLSMIQLSNLLVATTQQKAQAIQIVNNEGMNQLAYFQRHARFMAFQKQKTEIVIYPLAYTTSIAPFGLNVLSKRVTEFQGRKVLTTVDHEQCINRWDLESGLYLKTVGETKVEKSKYAFYGETNIHKILFEGSKMLELFYYHDYSGNGQNNEFKIYDITSVTGIICTQKCEEVLSFKFVCEMNEKLFFDEKLTKMIHFQNDSDSSQIKCATLYHINIEGVQGTLEKVKVYKDMAWNIWSSTFDNLFSPGLKYYLKYNQALKTYDAVSLNQNQNSIILINAYDEGEIQAPIQQDEVAIHCLMMSWITDYLILDLSCNGMLTVYEIQDDNKTLRTHIIYDQTVTYKFKDQENFSMMMHQIMYEQVIRKLSSKERKLDVAKRLKQKLLDQVQHLSIVGTSTMYHWQMASKIIQDNSTTLVDSLSKHDACQLLSNLFTIKDSNQNTFLHLAVIGLQALSQIKQQVSQQSSFNIQIFESLFSKIQKNKDDFEFHFLYWRNKRLDNGLEWLCPLQILLNKNNSQGINLLLTYLKYHPLNFHSEELAGIIPQLLQRPSIAQSLGEYLESRIIASGQHLKRENSFYTIENDDFVAIHNRDYTLTSLKQIPARKYQLTQNVIAKQSEVIFNELKVQADILDIHLVPIKGEDIDYGYMFRMFKSISTLDNYEYILSLRAVQVLIDNRWIQMRKYIIGNLFIPYILQIGIFIAYSNVFNGQLSIEYRIEHESEEQGFLALSILLYIFCTYFLIHEIFQMVRNKTDYFTKSLVWNLLDVIPSCLIIAVVTIRLIERYSDEEIHISSFINTIHSLASLLLWLKSFYFLRLFNATSYLIKIIMGTFYDMKEFLLILFIVEIGFGEAFLRLSEATDPSEDGHFLNNFASSFVFTFRMSLADNDTDAFNSIAQPVMAWILFIVCGLFTNIVMLNLLISIIGQSFDRINQKATVATFKERADLIYDNGYLLQAPFTWLSSLLRIICRMKKEDQKPWLLIITDVNSATSALDESQILMKGQDSLNQSLMHLKEDLDTKLSSMELKINSIEKGIDNKFDILKKAIEELNLKLDGESTNKK